MELKDIQNLIKFVAKSGASEVKLEMEDIKITIKTGGAETPVSSQHIFSKFQQLLTVVPPAPAVLLLQVLQYLQQLQKMSTQLSTIKSPIIGTFYRKPSPDKPIL